MLWLRLAYSLGLHAFIEELRTMSSMRGPYFTKTRVARGSYPDSNLIAGKGSAGSHDLRVKSQPFPRFHGTGGRGSSLEDSRPPRLQGEAARETPRPQPRPLRPASGARQHAGRQGRGPRPPLSTKAREGARAERSAGSACPASLTDYSVLRPTTALPFGRSLL